MEASFKLDKEAISKNFKVVIRVRPPLPRELDAGFVNCVQMESGKMIALSENFAKDQEGQDPGVYPVHAFTFDQVYDPDSEQKYVYETTAREAVVSTLQGYNATIIAYGQTGTGKTYTMEGFTRGNQPGIIPRSIEEIFSYIQHTVNQRTKFLVRASFLQIYNEVISDLLKPDRSNLTIREDKKKGVFVEGLSEWVVRSPQEIFGLMQRGASVRATGSTRMNEVSSRSHAVFVVIVEQSESHEVEDGSGKPAVRQLFKIGKLNLVDLAGSERVRLTGATGRRLEESKKINQSLAALGNVIAALTDPSRAHIPYRDSKLTRILEDSLGGNCKTTMMAMISPAMEAFNENLSTLKFANRAKNIKNDPRINEDLDQKALLRKYERELKRLRTELDERSKNVVDKRKLLELEEQKRRAEEDKLAALVALEKRSKEFMMEKEEKRRLEERIVAMQSQLLTGGTAQSVADLPAFRSALQQEHSRIRKEYETRLQELELERQGIEEDKAQVDRYKQLLLKQRDIMIALTARLNERDESILALQEELDAYDRHQRMMEDILDQKTAMLIHWQRLALEANPSLREDYIAHGGSDPGGELRLPLTSAPSNASLSVGTPLASMPAITERKYPAFQAADVVMHGRTSTTPMLLTGDEKVQELTSLLEAQKKDQEQLSRELEDVQSEKVSLEYLLREKLEKMVQTEIEERINTYRREVEQWKANHSLAEERRRLSEYMLELAKLNSENAEFYEKVQKIMEKESELLQKPFQEQLERFKAELQSAQDDKKAAADEAAQLRTELSRLKVKGDGAVDVEQLWQRVQLAEEEVKLLKAKQATPSAPVPRAAPAAVDNSAELQTLRTQAETNSKERAALKTIMESKIKGLVDNVMHIVQETGELATVAGGRMHRDLSALQKLVNASIVALRNSDMQSHGGAQTPQQTPQPSTITRPASATPLTPTAASTPVPVSSAYATLPTRASYSGSALSSVPQQRPASVSLGATGQYARAPTPTKSHIDTLIQQKRLELQQQQQQFHHR
eukprot:TRINITY_DN4002_c0_g2_i1.p1 TRINITY_DN4002_c0_g2~~TRINITY_DN4002_c0_g2_i1.p1  ORF type:complete len:1024 (+),score=306.20 TRINITY_DN4002_c0_g2_i1:27-3098(+)